MSCGIIFCILGLFFIGAIPEYAYLRGNGVIRHSLGFCHPNTLGFAFLTLSILYCLKKHQFKIGDYILLILIALFLYLIPNSETPCVCIFIMGSYLFIKDNVKYKKRNRIIPTKIKKGFLFLGVVGLVVIVYLVAYTGIGANHISKISGTLYTRFIHGATAIKNYGFSLWGQYIPMVGEDDILKGAPVSSYFTIDCVYFYLPIVIGIFPSCFFAYYYIHSMIVSLNKKNRKLLMAAFILLFYGIAEVNAISLFSSYLFVLARSQSRTQFDSMNR